MSITIWVHNWKFSHKTKKTCLGILKFFFFLIYKKIYENTSDSLNQRSWTRWGQKWNLTQMHKWYRSWWIDPHIVQELSVKEQTCATAGNFSQKISKCWSQMVSILVDRSTHRSRALGDKTVHTVDRSTHSADRSTPYWKMT